MYLCLLYELVFVFLSHIFVNTSDDEIVRIFTAYYLRSVDLYFSLKKKMDNSYRKKQSLTELNATK